MTPNTIPYCRKKRLSDHPLSHKIERIMPGKQLIVPVERIERSILLVRGQRVILDADLAQMYGVTTKRLNE